VRQLERHHQASSETARTRCAARSIGDERPCTRCGIGSPVLLMSRPSLMKARRSSIESSVHEASSNELQPARVASSRHLMRGAIRRNQMQSRRNQDALKTYSRGNQDAIGCNHDVFKRGMPTPAIRGHQSSSARTSQQRSSEVIRGHQRSSELIRGHQRSSELISGGAPASRAW
jgi:hypothetical protein